MSFHRAVHKICNIKRKELSRYQILYGLRVKASLAFSGSLTVETAIVLPLFLIVMLSFLSLFSVIQFQAELQAAMDHAVQKAAVYYYAIDLIQNNEEAADEVAGANGISRELLTGGITDLYLRAEILSEIDEKVFERARVWGKKAGLSFLQSKFPDNEGVIDLVVSYQIQLPFLPSEKARLFMSQRSRRMAWKGSLRWKNEQGDGEEETEETIVYVTETGKVYHLELTCSYLRLNIRSVRPDEVASLRNKSGGKYTACEKCGNDIVGFYVYITDSGDRYHNKLQCSGLTRNINRVLLSEVETLPPCSRCGKAD